MNIRTVETDSSIWKFDIDLKRYIRFPKGESSNEADMQILFGVPYTGEWDEYVSLSRTEDNRILVVRPVPFGTGQLRLTGNIVWDDLETGNLVEREPSPGEESP